MITFEVDDVVVWDHSSPHVFNAERINFFKNNLEPIHIKKGTVEAFKYNCAETALSPLNCQSNAFVHTALSAYRSHRNITFGPEEIWLTILQGITSYIAANPEECRRIVGFEGKKTLTITNGDFRKGAPNNPWEREFGKFTDQIERYIGNRAKLFAPMFTTTGPVSEAAINLQMMAALAPYFEYKMMTCCGVPKITLLGLVSDWQAIEERLLAFEEFLPSWLLSPMRFVIENFVSAAKGSHDLDFWQNFFKTRGGSGGTPIGGFINLLFLYVDGGQNKVVLGDFKNNVMAGVNAGSRGGNEVGDFPGAMGSVPMEWNYYGTIYNMRLASGLIGYQYDADLGYRCVTGWVVGEDNNAV